MVQSIFCLTQDTACLGLVHGDDPERCYGEGGGRGVHVWERMQELKILKFKKKIKKKESSLRITTRKSFTQLVFTLENITL